MSTTVHIPQPLLTEIDRKVKALNISRNKYICMVLEKDTSDNWPKYFLNKKIKPDKKLIENVDEMMKIIMANRNNKNSGTF